jgi:hypothetical protein
MTNYLQITDHIYFNGYSFRVRFIKDGIKHSKYFKNRKDAIKFKNQHTKS